MPPTVIVICGPTATGKTKLGVALAHAFQGEVVSADSMQLYRGMAVGTAQPTLEEREGIPHHMIAVADPGENYSAARYAREASACVEDILARGKQPIIVGGTGLYIDALLTGRDYACAPTPACRAQLQRRAETQGLPALWAELQGIDPQAAARLHPNDAKRVLRALEVWYETGETITQHDLRTRALPPRYAALTLALTYQDRQALYRRIDARVDQMLRQGLLEEVRGLLDQGLESTAMQAIGYKELVPVLRGQCELEEAVEAVKRHSRQYAKRQLTWFRRKEGIWWLELGENPDFSAAIQVSTRYLQEKGLR